MEGLASTLVHQEEDGLAAIFILKDEFRKLRGYFIDVRVQTIVRDNQ